MPLGIGGGPSTIAKWLAHPADVVNAGGRDHGKMVDSYWLGWGADALAAWGALTDVAPGQCGHVRGVIGESGTPGQ
jgi:hypothetical protein